MSKHSNQRLSTYIDKYCQKHGIGRKEALKHELVKLVKEQYEQENHMKIDGDSHQSPPGPSLRGRDDSGSGSTLSSEFLLFGRSTSGILPSS